MKHFQDITNKLNRVQNFLENQALDIIGIEGIRHFQKALQDEGFTTDKLEKWQEVKRRTPGSSWYGFQYGSTANRPGKKRRKENSKTNYSDAATRRPILSGTTQELLNSFEYSKASRGSVIINNTAPYAKIQNEGGEIKVFGKRTATIPKRTFMGSSPALIRKIEGEIMRDINKILR